MVFIAEYRGEYDALRGVMEMTNLPPKTVLCMSSYEKGQEFIRECKRLGWQVILLTVTTLEHAKWPRESIDEVYYMPDLSKVEDVIFGVSSLSLSWAHDLISE